MVGPDSRGRSGRAVQVTRESSEISGDRSVAGDMGNERQRVESYGSGGKVQQCNRWEEGLKYSLRALSEYAPKAVHVFKQVRHNQLLKSEPEGSRVSANLGYFPLRFKALCEFDSVLMREHLTSGLMILRSTFHLLGAERQMRRMRTLR